MGGPPSLRDLFTHDRDRCIACLRLALAERLNQGDCVYHGFAAHFVPRAVAHVLRVCLIANQDYRIHAAAASLGVSERRAAKVIRDEDHPRYEWVYRLTHRKPWDPGLYDIVVPMQDRTVAEAVELIRENAARPALQKTEASQLAMKDFLLAATVGKALADAGHFYDVTADDGRIRITLTQEVFLKARLEGKLRELAGSVKGVRDVAVRLDTSSQMETPFGSLAADAPIKLLLVDDEREFVETLSERLRVRELQPAVAYDGEQALASVARDEPEVMILDLKMPGIDGMEVLRKVRKERPAVEVIILTGHGSGEDEQMARDLGAFAYLEKPVDIATLIQVVKEAYAKAQRSRDIPERSS